MAYSSSGGASGFLDDVWRMYYHRPLDPDWTEASYRSLGTISTPEEFWGIHGAVRSALSGGMFFLMRENIFPCWDDPGNIGGGALSFRVPRDAAEGFWTALCRRLLTERLMRAPEPEAAARVCGLSISPKGANCVVKVWLARSSGAAAEEAGAMELPPECGAAMYTAHLSSIRGLQASAAAFTPAGVPPSASPRAVAAAAAAAEGRGAPPSRRGRN